MHNEMDQVAKRLSVEVNDSAKLCAQMYEQAATYRRHLTAAVAREWTLAKTGREEVEKNALERDWQGQKQFGEYCTQESGNRKKNWKFKIKPGKSDWN